jgi:hypothetical protein
VNTVIFPQKLLELANAKIASAFTLSFLESGIFSQKEN